MIGTLRRHQQWLWIFIILAIIISFVVYFSPNSSSFLEGAGRPNFGSINDRPITQEQYRDAAAEVSLLYFLRTGQWPTGNEAQQTGFDLERETYSRIVLVEKLKELKIEPNSEATAKWISGIFNSDPSQPFPMERFQGFVKNELAARKLTAEDFFRFARHQVGQQHLVSVYGLSGSLITEKEAESFYRRVNEPMATEAVFFSASNYLSNVAMTPAAIGQFYTNNMAAYRLPERVQVNYVKWDVTNFLAEADQEIAKTTNLTQMLEAAYFQQGTNAFTDDDGKTLSKDAAIAKMKDDQRKGLARLAARKKANEFLTVLMEGRGDKTPSQSDDLQKLAKEKGLDAKTTPPFSEADGTENLKLPPAFVTAAFNLKADAPHDSTIVAEDGVYVIALNKRIPSENQPFETVREQVTKDYREQQSIKLAREAGAAFEKTLTNGLASGKTFSALGTEAKVKPVALPHFSLSTQDLPQLDTRVRLDLLQNVAASLAPGEASRFIPSNEGGFVLHLIAKLPVDETKLKAELPEYLNRQRDQRMSAAYSEWFQGLEKELKLVVPTKTSDGKS